MRRLIAIQTKANILSQENLIQEVIHDKLVPTININDRYKFNDM